MQFDRLEAKIDRLLSLLEKPARKAPIHNPLVDLLQQRVTEIERLFWNLVNSPLDKRRDSLRFPKALLGSDLRANIQGVVVSTLINQASLRKCFRIKGQGDSVNDSQAAIARRVLDQTNLILVPFTHTRLDSTSPTLVALSPGEAERVANRGSVPAEFKGWSCVERAKGRQGPVGYIPAPEDPCGARVWDLLAELEEEIEEEIEELEEIEEEEAPSPIKKLDYRSRVQFVMEDE